MRLDDDDRTRSKLIRDVSNWQDHSAWVRFRNQYDRYLRRWCRGYGLDDDSIDEVCQLIWIELADRMKTFQYDPNRTFRGWLRRVCESRVVDFLRQKRDVCLFSIDDRDDELATSTERAVSDSDGTDEDQGDGHSDLLRLLLLDEAENVQAQVKARVKPWTWEAFWLVAVYDWTVERTADALGMTHASVYAARERVARMLCDEGKRVSDHWAANS